MVTAIIRKILEKTYKFEITVTKKMYLINFPSDCNSCCEEYLILTLKVCLTQYVGSTVTRFILGLNQCRSNVKLYQEGRHIKTRKRN